MRSGRSGGSGRKGGAARAGRIRARYGSTPGYGLGEGYWDKRAQRGTRSVGHINSSPEEFEQDTQAAWSAIKPPSHHYMGGRVLDFGAGWGRFTTLLSDEADVYAVDASAEMCKLSNDLVRHVPPATPLPFEDDFFTGLFIYAVLQHVPNGCIAWQCAELRRVLAPGSYMIICDAIGHGTSQARGGHSTVRTLPQYQALFPGLKRKGPIPGGIYQPTLLLAGWKVG